MSITEIFFEELRDKFIHEAIEEDVKDFIPDNVKAKEWFYCYNEFEYIDVYDIDDILIKEFNLESFNDLQIRDFFRKMHFEFEDFVGGSDEILESYTTYIAKFPSKKLEFSYIVEEWPNNVNETLIITKFDENNDPTKQYRVIV